MERCTQRIRPGKFDAFIALEKQFDAAESRLGGVPLKRRYMMGAGGSSADTNVWEREWDSLAAYESYQERSGADREFQALVAETADFLQPGQFELLIPINDLMA